MIKKQHYSTGKRILFACFPGEGHFNPLTGLAVHLANEGYDVRWYCSSEYAPRLKAISIPHLPFKKALEISASRLKDLFPDRDKATSKVAKLKYDIVNVFIKQGPKYYEDIKDIYNEFPFDLLIADCAFTGIPFVKDLMKIPVISVGVFPLTETSKDLAPTGLGVVPSYTFFGKIKMAALRQVAKQILFREPDKILHAIFDAYKIPHNRESLFDMLIKKSTLFLQSGTPAFEYYRSDLSKHIKFIGPLLPYSSGKKNGQWFDDRLTKYKKIVLVTQGTVEKDCNKIIIPTLEAFKNSDTLVICTTGGSETATLKQKYSCDNIIVEDFIPFADVMPYADVYITNGGYGGVMLGIENKLPMVVAGVHEGKNEICARIGFFKYGIDLKTETPLPSQIKNAVEKVMSDNTYKANVVRLADEFAQYNPAELTTQYVNRVLHNTVTPNVERESLQIL